MTEKNIKQSYETNPEYWRKDSPRLQGDLEQRPRAVEMLGDVNNRHILEAGCGTGYVARIVARKGAFVTGIDNSVKMLRIAKQIALQGSLATTYELGDVTDILHEDSSFEGIISVGVVHHLSPDEYQSFLKQARRVLKKDSPLVISLVHPTLFYAGSPARNDKKCSTKFHPLENKTFDQSQRFSMELYDTLGNHFDSTMWYHPIGFLLNAVNVSGFKIKEINEPIFRKEHRLTPAWGKAYGYPTHFQIKATKVGW